MKNVLRFLSLLLFMQSGFVYSMQSNGQVSAAAQEEIQEAIEQARRVVANQPQIDVNQLLEDARQPISNNDNDNNDNTISFADRVQNLEDSLRNFDEEDRPGNDVGRAQAGAQVYNSLAGLAGAFGFNGAPSIEQERERVMNLNTVLLGHPKVPIALYKRDLITLPFMAIDVAIAYKMFQLYKKNCVEHIYKTITKDPDTFITLLKDLAQAKQTVVQKGLSRKERAEINKKIKELNEKFVERCTYIKSSSFKAEMAAPLLMAIGGHKASAYARKHLTKVNYLLPESFNAYTRNNDGEYERFELDPMYHQSDQEVRLHDLTDINAMTPGTAQALVVNFLRFFLFNKAPMSVSRATSFPVSSNVGLADGYIPEVNFEAPNLTRLAYRMVGLPNWFYTVSTSKITHAVIEAAVIWQTLQFIDNLLVGSWIKAATNKESKELILLLENYKLASTEKNKEGIATQLKQFVVEHTVMPSWRTACGELYKFIFLSRDKVNSSIQARVFAVLGSILLWKGRAFIKAGYGAIKDGMIPPEIGLPVAFYAIGVFGIPWAMAAGTVCKDIWKLSKKAIGFVKSKISKKKKNKQENNQSKSVLIGGA